MLQLCPQHGPLPTNPEEGSKLSAICLRRNFAGGLGGDQATRKSRLPVGKNHLQLGSKGFRKSTHFLPHIPDQTATPEIVTGHTRLRASDEGFEASHWQARLIVKIMIHFAREKSSILFYQLCTESLFAFKVMIERTFGNTDPAQNFVNPGGRETFLGKNLQARAQQQITRFKQTFT